MQIIDNYLTRILIDECIDERLRFFLSDFDCQTARFAGFAGLKNGHLLTAADEAGFDILITTDQSMPDQQNLSWRMISVVILCGRTNRLRDLEPLIPAAISAIRTISQGRVVRVDE